jgi:TPR repeat protein
MERRVLVNEKHAVVAIAVALGAVACGVAEQSPRRASTPSSSAVASAVSSARSPSSRADVPISINAAKKCARDIEAERSRSPIPDGVDIEADCKEALSRAQLGCKNGGDTDCSLAKTMEGVLKILPVLHEADVARACGEAAVDACTSRCDGGDLDACVEVGTMYTEGRRVPRDPGRAAGIFLAACLNGSMRACYMYGAGSLATDPNGAAASLKTACEGDDGPYREPACSMLRNTGRL